jgi:hypothetical protein
MKCPECESDLIETVEEVLTVTIRRASGITGIQYLTEDGEVLFDYDDIPVEDDLDETDIPVYYECGFCGKEIDKATIVELFKAESTEDYIERIRIHR